MSSVITSEFAATRIRGRMMTTVFSAQGWGQFTAAIVSVIVVAAYKNDIVNGPATVPGVDRCWRLLIGIGCIPAVIGLYFRYTLIFATRTYLYLTLYSPASQSPRLLATPWILNVMWLRLRRTSSSFTRLVSFFCQLLSSCTNSTLIYLV